MFYEVIAQFAKAGAPSFYTPGYEGYLSEAKDYFNIRSRVATNPKEITELGIIDDKTIRIIFRSHDKLRLGQISRSLRVFSMYLIDETHPLNFSSLISGKRLFRMHASEFASDEAEEVRLQNGNGGMDGDMEPDVEMNKLYLIEKMCLLLREMDRSSENIEAVREIDTILESFLERRK